MPVDKYLSTIPDTLRIANYEFMIIIIVLRTLLILTLRQALL